LRLLVPVLLVILLISSALLANHSILYAGVLVSQVVLYLLGALGSGRGIPLLMRVAAPASAFCMLNAAIVVGFYKFLFTRGPLWKIWTSGVPASVARMSERGMALRPTIVNMPLHERNFKTQG
jgi:predicted membrane-bound mannosyltransferase